MSTILPQAFELQEMPILHAKVTGPNSTVILFVEG